MNAVNGLYYVLEDNCLKTSFCFIAVWPAWTWFGGRMIQQLIANGFVEDAYELAQPMFNRVLKNGDFHEWYKLDGTPAGSAEFKGSAGVLAKSKQLFYKWAEENK